jgi:hypothetical protein
MEEELKRSGCLPSYIYIFNNMDMRGGGGIVSTSLRLSVFLGALLDEQELSWSRRSWLRGESTGRLVRIPHLLFF